MLTDDCQEKLLIAVLLCEKILNGLGNGGITLEELAVTLERRDSFIGLLQCHQRKEILPVQQVNTLLDCRQQEMIAFHEHKDKVHTLISLFKKANPSESWEIIMSYINLFFLFNLPECMSHLEVSLQQAFVDMNISTLWLLRPNQRAEIVMKFVPLGDKLSQILDEVNNLVHSRLFNCIWDEVIRACKSPIRTIDDITTCIWNHSEATFRNLLSELESGSISLYHVTHFFANIE